MKSSLDFLHTVSTGNLFLDNSFLADDERLMKSGSFFGYDNILGETTFFEIHSNNLRDSVISVKSSCINRVRQLVSSVAILNKMDPAVSLEELIRKKYVGKKILLLEHNSKFASIFSFYSKRHEAELITSEYFGSTYKSGDIIDTVLNVDIQKTHFPDNYFDLILHTDVFEHVPDAPEAEKEVVRILKPGAAVVFTVPFDYSAAEDDIYADIFNNEIRYFKEPVFHDDPVSPDGKCLVFRVFSFPATKKRFKELGCKFQCNYIHSKYMGILGNNAYSFIAVKK